MTMQERNAEICAAREKANRDYYEMRKEAVNLAYELILKNAPNVVWDYELQALTGIPASRWQRFENQLNRRAWGGYVCRKRTTKQIVLRETNENGQAVLNGHYRCMTINQFGYYIHHKKV